MGAVIVVTVEAAAMSELSLADCVASCMYVCVACLCVACMFVYCVCVCVFACDRFLFICSY